MDSSKARTVSGFSKSVGIGNTTLFAKVYSSLEIVFAENLVPLAEALHKNPRLKPLVYEIRIPGFYAHQFEEAQELTKWEEKLDIQDTSAWLAVVLISLPNLQHLDLRWGDEGQYTASTLWAVSKIASKSPREDLPLQHLQKLSAGSEEAKENFAVQEFIPFLKLPSVRAVHLSCVVDRDGVDEDSILGVSFDLPQRVSPVRKLVLQSSNIRHGLPNFIAACAHLEHFEYQHSNQFEWGEEYRNFRSLPFRAALLPQKESLRVLRLNDVGVTKPQGGYDLESREDIRESKAQAWFGSLVGFVALKELRMPVRNLLDCTAGKEPNIALSEVLPSSLEVLVFTKVYFVDYPMLEGQLRRLLDIKEQQFRQLRKLSLQAFQMEVFPGEDTCWETRNWAIPRRAEMVFAGVRSLCEEHGVEFSFAHVGDFQIVANGEVVDDTDEIDGRSLGL